MTSISPLHEPIEWFKDAITPPNRPLNQDLFEDIISTLTAIPLLTLHCRKVESITGQENASLITTIFFLYFLKKELDSAPEINERAQSDLVCLLDNFQDRIEALPGQPEFYKEFLINKLDEKDKLDFDFLVNMHTKLIFFETIFQLETSAQLNLNKRAPEFNEFHFLKSEDYEAIFKYIEYLNYIIEEGEATPERGVFIQLNNESTLIDMKGITFARGTYGLLRAHQAKSYEVFKKSYVSKQDLDSNDPHVENEYLALKHLHKQLSPEEKEFILPLAAGIYAPNDKGERIFNCFLTEQFDSDLHDENDLSLEAKNIISKHILTSIYILLHKDFVLPDIKLKNMLYKETYDTYKAVPCDFAGLTDLKGLDWLSVIKTLAKNIKIWNPYHLPFEEYLKIGYTLATTSPSEIKASFFKMQQFCGASALFDFYTGKTPYKLHLASSIPECPPILKTYATQRADNSSEIEGGIASALDKAGCDASIRDAIVKMTQPKPDERYTLAELTELIRSFNLLKI